MRDVFHILQRLRLFLNKKHPDFRPAFAGYVDIFERLRNPEQPLDIGKIKYEPYIEEEDKKHKKLTGSLF